MNFIEELENELRTFENYEKVVEAVVSSMTPEMTDKDILEHVAITCFSFVGSDYNYDLIATKYYLRFMSYDLKKKYSITDYSNTLKDLEETNIISSSYLQYCYENIDFINSLLQNEENYALMNFFGLKTIEKLYLLKDVEGKLIELPNHMYLRVAIQIHIKESKENVIEEALFENVRIQYSIPLQNQKIHNTYKLLSNLYYTHATPTCISSGFKQPQLSSCFLMQCPDNIEGIAKIWGDMAQISKYGGGIGVNISEVRGKGAIIKSNNGKSDGIIPLIKTHESIAKYVNQRSVRSGSIAEYIEPWHIDILAFLDLRKITGYESERARDIFMGLWIPDLFMECVEQNLDWYLMTPDVCPGLTDTYGDDFKKLYYEYVDKKMYVSVIKASDLFYKIMEIQFETGMPYMLYKDACNKKSNQKNLGVIKNSNLCAEIVEYSNDDEIACCNLASISLPKFINNHTFDFELLGKTVMTIVENLNNIIDVNYYPVQETQNSNFKHRPIGLGVQGLADVYFSLGHAFDSDEAFKLNKKIFECIYYYSLKSSMLLALKDGAYQSFNGSPFSQGLLQFHLWNLDHKTFYIEGYPSYDWDELVENIKRNGTRNSLITALMPTASTSQVLGNYECFEPYTANIFVRKVGVREFTVINKHLVKEFKELNLWNEKLYFELIYNGGSVQNLTIPAYLKNKYKTASELKQAVIVKQAIDRGPFIDQTQSMNIFMTEPNYDKLKKSHFYGWKHGLKTGMYYLRCGIKMGYNFGIDPELQKEFKKKYETPQCTDEVCVMCSA